MAAIVCRGLQSHLESQIVESRTLRLRLPSSKPVPTQSFDLAFKSCFWDSNLNTHYEENNDDNKGNTFQENYINSKHDTGGWSFLEALSNVSQETKDSSALQKEPTYVHPQQKRSSMVLSPKSLELCTENLGNESGTDIGESGIDMLCSSNCSGGYLETGEQREKNRQYLAAKKAKTTQNFPPPLTTIRGSESLRVRPHREDGRLVIEVTKVPPSASCFQAERSHGRLRLCFLTNHTPSFDPQEEAATQDSEGFEEEEFESEMSGQTEDAEKEEEEKTGEETEEEDVACECEDCDVRMENYERLRRCNEGGDHENNELLLNWNENLWVASS